MGHQPAPPPPTTYLDPRLLTLPSGISSPPSPEVLEASRRHQLERDERELERRTTAFYRGEVPA